MNDLKGDKRDGLERSRRRTPLVASETAAAEKSAAMTRMDENTTVKKRQKLAEDSENGF